MKINNRKIVWEGKFLRTVILDYEDRSGNIRQWETVERKGADGVIIVAAITAEGKVILIKQYRPALDSYVIEMPAGLMEPGESPPQTTRRELIEETGYASDDITRLSDGVISTGVIAEDWHIMLAAGARAATPAELAAYPPDDTEDIEVIAIPMNSVLNELEDMEQKGERVDVRIYGILALAARELTRREEG